MIELSYPELTREQEEMIEESKSSDGKKSKLKSSKKSSFKSSFAKSKMSYKSGNPLKKILSHKQPIIKLRGY